MGLTKRKPSKPMADNTGVNYLTLITIIQVEMKKHLGSRNIDHDLCQNIAWEIAGAIPSNVILPKASETTIHEVLEFAEEKGLSNE